MAVDILKRDGNAVDAAIAANAMEGLQPTQMWLTSNLELVAYQVRGCRASGERVLI